MTIPTDSGIPMRNTYMDSSDAWEPKKVKAKFKSGALVSWRDPVTKQLKIGELVEKHQVVAEANAELVDGDDVTNEYEPIEDLRDVDYWEWEIKGADGKTYSFKESELNLVSNSR